MEKCKLSWSVRGPSRNENSQICQAKLHFTPELMLLRKICSAFPQLIGKTAEKNSSW